MNCENPIYVKNRTRRFGSGVTKLGFWVPCGKCEACRERMRQEWFIRAFCEWKDCTEKGGTVYFPTFTYRPDALPVFNTDSGRLRHGEEKSGIPCFDKKDIDTYLKRVRKKLERLGVKGVRYIVCSEYGTSDNGTHRPHYHCLIFMPKNNLDSSMVKDIILDSWQLGYAFWSDKGAEVEQLAGIKYVSKYCCKQIDFFSRKDLQDYVDGGSLNAQRIKRYLPNHWQSKGFGLYLADWLLGLPDEERNQKFLKGVSSELLGLGESKFYNIPRYIINKILYTTTEEGVRVPTDRAHEVMMSLYQHKIDNTEKSLRKFFTVQGLRSKIDSEDMDKVLKTIEKYEYDNSYIGLVTYLNDKLAGRSLEDLAIYKKVYQNLTMDGYDKEICDFMESASSEEIRAIGYSLVDAQYDNDYYDEVTEKSAYDEGKFVDVCVWNQLHRFEYFDLILEVIDRINGLSSKRIMRKKKKDREIENKLKNLL